MRSLAGSLILFAAVAWVAPRPAVAEGASDASAQYVGVDGCASCHKSAKRGNQLGAWKESGHSKAYETLASPKAQEIAKKRGIADPQKAEECLQCHVTAHGVDAAQIATPRKGKEGHVITNGVACESCHGPGSLYKPRKVMKDRDAAIAAGLVIPDEKLCRTCHNDKSPTFTGFDYEERLAKIAHPIPKKAGE